jgi:hypothetical protein
MDDDEARKVRHFTIRALVEGARKPKSGSGR